MKIKQRKKPEDRKKEIITVALELFLNYGFEKITMSEIAKTSGITKGLCYHYFPSKEYLYSEALSDFVENLTSEYLTIIKNQKLTIEERMDAMAFVLKSHQGKSLFYEFSRQQGNQHVYLDILYQTFNNLIPELAKEYITYNNLLPEANEKIKTLMQFILFGQLGILTKKEMNFETQLVQIREYIDILLKYESESSDNQHEN